MSRSIYSIPTRKDLPPDTGPNEKNKPPPPPGYNSPLPVKAADEASLVVSGAYKRYGRGPFVLNNFCMSVEHNCIYALLGASGCGKTTLLSAIVGKFPLDAGDIQLSITSRRQLGFMPQLTALYDEFSIEEMFQYFGILYSMSKREIEEQLERLIELLSLPNKQSICGKLSGGQQRRVSVAVTMMHSPRLLILDEPTAGLDHLIAETVWLHLRSLAEQGVTCIITTHYIEEARHAHKVGMMRKGVILEENSPLSLLRKYNSDSLEEVFFTLSKEQQVSSQHQGNNKDINKETEKLVLSKEKKDMRRRLYPDDVNTISMAHIWCQVFKYFNWMKRSFLVAMFIILLPTVTVFLFNLAFKNFPPLTIAVINEDSNCTMPTAMGCEERQTALSCHFISVLKNPRWQWKMIFQHDYEAALVDLDRNKVQAVLMIPKNFTGGIVGKLNHGNWVDKTLLATSFINADINRADYMLSQRVENGLLNGFQMFYRDFIKSCNLNDNLSQLPPMNFAEPIYGRKDPSFIEFIAAGFLLQTSFTYPILFSVSSLIAEKLLGLMDRTLIAGLTATEVILAHSLISITLVTIQTTISMIAQFWFWAHPYYGSILLGFALLVCEGICGTLFGFFVALSSESYFPGAPTVAIINTIITIACGSIWPIQGMHPWVRPFAFLLPPTTGIEALRAIIWKSYHFTHPEVLVGFLPPFIWTALFLVNMVIYVKRHQML